MRTSFRLGPATKEDYDKIIKADLLPEGVAVRRYIPRKWDPNNKNSNMGRNQFKPAVEVSSYETQLDEIGSLRDISKEVTVENRVSGVSSEGGT